MQPETFPDFYVPLTMLHKTRTYETSGIGRKYVTPVSKLRRFYVSIAVNIATVDFTKRKHHRYHHHFMD
jgi:hypothetical protein